MPFKTGIELRCVSESIFRRDNAVERDTEVARRSIGSIEHASPEKGWPLIHSRDSQGGTLARLAKFTALQWSHCQSEWPLDASTVVFDVSHQNARGRQDNAGGARALGFFRPYSIVRPGSTTLGVNVLPLFTESLLVISQLVFGRGIIFLEVLKGWMDLFHIFDLSNTQTLKG